MKLGFLTAPFADTPLMEVADWAAGAPSRTPRYATFAAGHEEMLIGDAVLESSRTGTWAKVRRA